MDEPFELPTDGVLDLHTIRPQDVKEVLPEYLAECRKRGLLEVSVIHGKGVGQMRRTVHPLLARQPEVASYAQASEAFGGWGATMVHLQPPPNETTEGASGHCPRRAACRPLPRRNGMGATTGLGAGGRGSSINAALRLVCNRGQGRDAPGH